MKCAKGTVDRKFLIMKEIVSNKIDGTRRARQRSACNKFDVGPFNYDT